MEHLGFALLALFLLAYGLVSKRLESSVVTPAMVFSGFGVLMGPAVLGVFEFDVEGDVLNELAEATLILVLFADASTIDLEILRKNFHLPLRLLGVGLPLTMALGAGVALLLFDGLTIWEAALAAVILSPTDAALGQAVVSSPRVPVRIRQALNVESGLNDGICLPFVMILIALASDGASQPASYWTEYALGQVVLGPAAGIAVGFTGARAVSWASRRGWINHAFLQISSIALALLTFSAAEMIGGNGFIAAFVGGLVVGNTMPKHTCEQMLDFAETEGQLLGLLAFLVFGAVDIVTAFRQAGALVFLYAALSLTLIRMLPVSVSLAGAKLGLPTHLFLGWFGPRGLASILYVLLALQADAIAARQEIFGIVVCTVLLSVVSHGITAAPGARTYSEIAARRTSEDPECAEGRHVEEMPVRMPFRGRSGVSARPPA